MKTRKSLTLCVLSTAISTLGAATTLFTAGPAQAALFNFSYQFFPLDDGAQVYWKGTVSGTLLPDGNTVQTFGEQPTSSFSSDPLPNAPCPTLTTCEIVTVQIPLSNTLFTKFTLDGSEVVGRAGSLPDVLNGNGAFVLVSTNSSSANDFSQGGLGFSTPFALFGIPGSAYPVTPGEQSRGLQPYDQSRWTAAAVPEPTTITGCLLAGGSVMLKMLKRKKKKIHA
jgi:hypothetical protein